MKRSLLIGSFLCVLIGVVALICAFTEIADIPVILTVLIAYFIGIPLQFYKTLPDEDASLLSSGQIIAIMGRRFWGLIALGVVSAIALTFVIRANYHQSISSSILTCLGMTAILTAFVSPKYKRIDEPEGFG